jgi:hypothetical protein
VIEKWSSKSVFLSHPKSPRSTHASSGPSSPDGPPHPILDSNPLWRMTRLPKSPFPQRGKGPDRLIIPRCTHGASPTLSTRHGGPVSAHASPFFAISRSMLPAIIRWVSGPHCLRTFLDWRSPEGACRVIVSPRTFHVPVINRPSYSTVTVARLSVIG